MLKWTKAEPYLIKDKEKAFIIKGPGFTEIARAVIDRGANLRFQAKGFSMSPFIKDGDFITITPLKDRLLKKGDIVAFYDPDLNQKLYVHRIINTKRNAYLIRGDNLYQPDGLISPDHILGIVKEVSRGKRKIRFGIQYGAKGIAFFSRRGCLLPVLLAARRAKGIFKRGQHAGR